MIGRVSLNVIGGIMVGLICTFAWGFVLEANFLDHVFLALFCIPINIYLHFLTTPCGDEKK